jgi:hypothetical protein
MMIFNPPLQPLKTQSALFMHRMIVQITSGSVIQVGRWWWCRIEENLCKTFGLKFASFELNGKQYRALPGM